MMCAPFILCGFASSPLSGWFEFSLCSAAHIKTKAINCKFHGSKCYLNVCSEYGMGYINYQIYFWGKQSYATYEIFDSTK